MALTAAETIDLRRFAGYPLIADPPDAMSAALVGLTPEAETVLRTVYLVNLRLLESDIIAVRGNADTAQAAVWHRNPNELAEREALFYGQVRRMCAFLGVPTGAQLVVSAVAASPAVFVV